MKLQGMSNVGPVGWVIAAGMLIGFGAGMYYSFGVNCVVFAAFTLAEGALLGEMFLPPEGYRSKGSWWGG